jgi:hypothetical protein
MLNMSIDQCIKLATELFSDELRRRAENKEWGTVSIEAMLQDGKVVMLSPQSKQAIKLS